MDHEKSYTNHQGINKIGCTRRLTEEIESDKICCNNKSYFIVEKK